MPLTYASGTTERTSVLIFSSDPLAAALIGAAVELAGYAPIFAREDESPRDVVMRTRPSAALVDCDHNDACTEAFFGPAMMVGARVAVFSSKRSIRTLQPIAAEFDVRLFTLPIDFEQLNALLADLTKRVEA
ncbi:MAG TPA: hypothetical protein VGM50_20120 [Gemmatimonadaceae bacterium]|jgi:hypothetical protein